MYVSLFDEAKHDKTNKMTCAPSEDLDQLGHPPSLIRIFAVRSFGGEKAQAFFRGCLHGLS